MKYDPNKHHRRSIRLKGHDYSQAAAYFVTICTQDRMCLFGDVVDDEMRLNEAGRVAQECWLGIPIHFPHVALDAFVIMPSHVHGIIVIADTAGAKDFSPLQNAMPLRSPSRTIGSIVRGFKIGVTKWFRTHADIYSIWQRDYYEHIIRNDESLNRIRQYILDNPAHWSMDRENPAARATLRGSS